MARADRPVTRSIRRLFSAASGALALGIVVASGPITPSPFWKNSVQFPNDPFRVVGGSGQSDWIKFSILTCDPGTVYYQNSNAFPFHYPFAKEKLDPFFGLTLAQFNAVTLFNSGREALLGAVVFPPPSPTQTPEYGIQFISQDALDPNEVVAYFNTVKGSVVANPGVQAFYFPAFEQLQSAEQNAAFFAANGIVISSPARWLSSSR